jgi:hypothetical protein
MTIYQVVQKLLLGDTQTDRQIDWWFDKRTFIYGKQAKNDHLYRYDTFK